MNKQLNMQDEILNYIRKNNIQTTIYLVNGFQFKGLVKGFDNFVIIIECEGKQQIVYKHAISTVCPSEKVDIQSILR